MKYLLGMLLLLSVVGCTEDNSSSEDIEISKKIIGEWKTSNCIAPGEVIPQRGAFTQRGIIFTESQISLINYHYADSECTDFEFENQNPLQDYLIGEQVTTSSGVIGHEIDWKNDLGDVSVTSYQIFTIIDEQLIIGIPISYGGKRATELDFKNIYNRISY